jgi:BlaI family transcriptional regulator, penicillinase repressor
LLTINIVVCLFSGRQKNTTMQKLTNKEEEIMQILWKLKKAFVKEVLAEIIEEQPHYNTLSTIIRNLEEKGFVSHNAFGNTHQYFPIVKMEDYRKRFMNTAIDTYFDSSYKNMVSFFAKEEKISAEELREILAMIENK